MKNKPDENVRENGSERGKGRRTFSTFKDGFTFMLVPTHGAIKQFFISRKLARVILAIVVVILIVTFAAVATYARLVMTASRVFVLQEENRRLRAEVATIDSIKSELIALQSFREQVLRMMGADSMTIEKLREMTYQELVQQYPVLQAPVPVAEGGGETSTSAPASFASPKPAGMPMPQPSSKPQNSNVPSGLPVMSQIYRVSLGFGGRHTGVDIATSYNTPVIATADGIVIEARSDTLYGNHVILKHKNGYETLYAHMSSIRVKKGERVRKGQLLGFVGMTGHTTGPHVHYEVRHNGIPLNPMPFIKQRG